MAIPQKKNSLFSGIILVLLAGIVAAGGMLWKGFVEFSENADGLDEVFSVFADRPGLILTSDLEQSNLLSFGFVVPRGELVKFLSCVQPHVASIAAYIGKEASLEITPNFPNLIKRIETGQILIGAVTAIEYAANRKRHNIRGFLERKGSQPKFTMFLVRQDSPITCIKDLKDKIIAYKNTSSMSGYKMPIIELARLGINPKDFFQREVFSNNLQTSVIGLLNQEFDCAVMSNTYYNEVDPAQRKFLREIHRTKPVPGGAYIVSGNTPASRIEVLQRAFISHARTIPANEEFGGFFQVCPLNPGDYDFLSDEEPTDDE